MTDFMLVILEVHVHVHVCSSGINFGHIHTQRLGLIHRDSESSVMRPLLYLQATTAGLTLVYAIERK